MEKEFEVILKPTDALECELEMVLGGGTGTNCTGNVCGDNSGTCDNNICKTNNDTCTSNRCQKNDPIPCTGKLPGTPVE